MTPPWRLVTPNQNEFLAPGSQVPLHATARAGGVNAPLRPVRNWTRDQETGKLKGALSDEKPDGWESQPYRSPAPAWERHQRSE